MTESSTASSASDLTKRRRNEKSIERFSVTVDCTKSLLEMIAAGNYGHIWHKITPENFPVVGEGIVQYEIALFHFDRDVMSKSVLARLDKLGYRPATLPELLSLGAAFPKLQDQFPIAALGSQWREDKRYLSRARIPFLMNCSRRDLALFFFRHRWMPECRFAAVLK